MERADRDAVTVPALLMSNVVGGIFLSFALSPIMPQAQVKWLNAKRSEQSFWNINLILFLGVFPMDQRAFQFAVTRGHCIKEK